MPDLTLPCQYSRDGICESMSVAACLCNETTSCAVFDGFDVTPFSNPKHHVVGREFLGTCWGEYKGANYRTVRWFCVGHDRQGYWLFATDGSGEWHNVSERAIGASFHEIIDEQRGDAVWKLCSFAWVPNYDHKSFHNARHPDWIGHALHKDGGPLTPKASA